MDVYIGALAVAMVVCLIGNLWFSMQARDRLDRIAELLEKGSKP